MTTYVYKIEYTRYLETKYVTAFDFIQAYRKATNLVAEEIANYSENEFRPVIEIHSIEQLFELSEAAE